MKKIYALIIIMKRMLTEDEFKMIVNEIDYEINLLDGVINVVPLESILNKIGFPNNWREIIYL